MEANGVIAHEGNANPAQPDGSAILNSARGRDFHGYHNTFHTRSFPSTAPPTFEAATSSLHGLTSDPSRRWGSLESETLPEVLPEYSCTVDFEGVLGMKLELSDPYTVSADSRWRPVYAIINGTQLHIHSLKRGPIWSGSVLPKPGRLLWTYTLQHAEVGLAADWKWTEADLEPRTRFAKMLPRSMRAKWWKREPDLFELPREHVLRLRLEDKQFLLCSYSPENMLDWIDQLCAGIDIAYPLEDRNEPKYRSLPRRTRRQRQIEAFAQDNLPPASNAETRRRLVAQQERILQEHYPNLGAPTSFTDQNESTIEERQQDSERDGDAGQDPEEADLDPLDAREDSNGLTPSTTLLPITTTQSQESPRASTSAREPYDPKTAPPRTEMSPNALIRFRRRCTPILLASSPRVSSVIICGGERKQLDIRRQLITSFTLNPPKYDPSTAPASTTTPILSFDIAAEVRPRYNRGATYATVGSSWTAVSETMEGDEVEVEQDDQDMSSLHSTATSRHGTPNDDDNLSRVSSTATDKTVGDGGKGKGILFTVRKIKVQQLRLHEHEHDEAAAAIAAHTPFVV